MAQLNLPPPPTGDDPKGVQFRDWFYKLSQFLKNNVFGTVTSVDVSGGTTGLTTSGGPITTSGTITLGGTLDVANGGTGVTDTPANGELLIGNGTDYTVATLTAGTNITITNGSGSITIDASGGGGSAFYNVLPSDVTIPADTSYVLVGYLDLNGFSLTVDGNLGIF
jgi:hypothetical protein